jgi:hypothetical protein
MEDQLPDVDLFHIEVIPCYLSNIAIFLMNNTTLKGYYEN